MRMLVMSGVVLALSGCLGPVSLHQAVLGYDRAWRTCTSSMPTSSAASNSDMM
jgi:hypothetical protein